MVTVEDRAGPRARAEDPAWLSHPVSWGVVLALAGSKVVFQLATSTLYGAHRDEFYYLESGYHLSFGYVDNPPLVPWLYRLQQAAFGHSVTALAVVPAVLGGGFVLLGALIAADLGGGRSAQGLAGLVAWLGPLFLTTSHFLGTVTIDLVVWAPASWLVIRIVRSGDTRWWLGVGVVTGIGLLNKDSVLFWMAAAGGGLLLTPQRRVLASWWLLGGAAIAGAFALPTLVWEVAHHWATLEFLRNLRAANASSDLTQFAPVQLVLTGLGGTVLWIVALVAVVRRPEWRPQRWLAYGYGIAFVLTLALGGKAYYLGSWYLPLVAVGAVVVEASWPVRRVQGLAVLTAILGVVGIPVSTPVLPASTAVAAHLDTANQDLGAMLGWPRVVDQIAAVVDTLPPDARHHVVIFTANYSQAGAVDFYGPPLGLPQAISGHNTFWLWGYGDPAPGATVVAVGLAPDFLRRYWSSVVPAGRLGTTGPPIDPQERGATIWVCRGQRVPWAVLWPAAKHYD